MAPILFDAEVTPDDLTTFTRAVPVPDDLALLNAFPTVERDTNTINFAELVETNRYAQYRSFDGRIHVSQRDAGSVSSVEMLPLSDSLNLGEYERLQLEFARTRGTNTGALANAIYNDNVKLTRNVQRRLELAWGDVLSDGILTVSEIDAGFEADFGVPADQIVAPATLWSNTAAATVLDDLTAWNDVWGPNGGSGGRIQTSRAVLRLVLRNTQLINAIYGAQTGQTRIRLTDLNDYLESEGLPTFGDTYDYQVVNDAGQNVRTVPANKLQFLPSDLSTLGYTAQGVSATALELVNSNESDLSFEEAPGIVGVVIKDGPPFRQYTFVDGVAMPVLADATKLLIATVTA